jgi:nucleotide-binding universal stress UspA family protein
MSLTMDRFQRLMVALTRSQRDEGLIRYAAMAARLAGAREVHFVHVPGERAGGNPLAPREQIAAELERAADSFGAAPEGIEKSFHVLRGPLIDSLLSFAAERRIDLILLGHRPGRRPGRKALIRRLTMKAPCSVWIVPDGSPPEISRVLAPVDFSSTSADALEVAADVATRAGAGECVALHVYQTEAVITYEEASPIVRGQEQEAYEKFAARLDLHGAKVRPAFVESAEIADAIHETAKDLGVDLKVMSTRGRSRSAAILLGNVTEGVIVEARTPLLVVKHFGAKLNLLETLLDRAFRRDDSPHFN